MLNERDYIERCIDSIMSSTYPSHMIEVLVADGGSSDGSQDVVRQLTATHRNLRLLVNPNRIASSAMNVGLAAAKGEYIIRMDAHSQYPSDYIQNCVEALEENAIHNVGGRFETKPGDQTYWAHALALLSWHPFGVGNSACRFGTADSPAESVPFGAFRADLLRKLGGFREDLARHEDFELNRRIARNGGKILLSSKIRTVYYQRRTVSAFLKKAYLDGFWLGPTWVRYPYTFALRHAVPAIFVCSLASFALAGFFQSRAWVCAGAVFSAYLAFSIVAAVQLAFRYGWKYAPVLPFLFAVYHISYGLGTIKGLCAALIGAVPRPSTTTEVTR